MKKLGILFATLIMAVLFALSASALNPTGQCGDNVKWSFNESEGKLLITGSGDMTDYNIETALSPFMGNSKIKSVVIDDGVTSVGDYAFTFCRGLTEITVPDSVTRIGVCSFGNCANVKKLTLGKGVSIIGSLAFDNCDGLTKLNLPASVTLVDEYAFQGCDGLTEVTLGNGVKTLNHAFPDCKNLKKVSFGNSVETIGDYAFSGCENLTDVTIPGAVLDIGKSAFQGCKSLTEINLPKSVQNVGETAFYECNSLKKFIVDSGNADYSADGAGVLYDKKKTELIQYPIGKTDANYTVASSAESIGDYAFANCAALVSITVPKGITYVGNYAFLGCTGVKNLTLPETVTVIGNATFYDCDGMTELTLPQGVTTVGNNAFGCCDKLTKLNVPATVTSLGDSILGGCDEFKEVNYRGSEAQWQAIKKGTYNTVLEGAKINYNVAPPQGDTHTHSYTSSVTTEPTCKTEGVRTYVCSCGDSYTEKIPTTSHDITETVIKADFEADGMHRESCKNCGYVVSENPIYKVDVAKLSKTKYTYDGKAKKPVVYLEDVWGTALKEGTDYITEYDEGRTKSGVYTVKVTLLGDREGEKELKFSILPGKTEKFVASQTTSSITLKWRKVEGATGYRVYQYNSKTGKYEKLKNTTGTTYTVKKLKAGTTYKFAVKAYTKDEGETLWASSYVKLTAATKPATPSVKATAGSKQATLSWSKVTGATGYVVYMRDESGDYNKLGSTKKTSYTKKSLKKGKTYYFRVRAYKTLDGKNIYGELKTVKVKVK